MRIFPFILVVLFFILAGSVSSPAQNAASVEPLLLYKAQQDKNCRHWVDSVMDKLSFKEKVGQLFIYTIAPVNTKRNLELLREAIDTYKVGGLLFSGGKMQNQVELTNRAQRQAKVPVMITEAVAMYPGITKMLDKLAKVNIIHKNKASNLKSKLALYINKLA